MSKETGGPAFPAQPIYRMPDGFETCRQQDGMTLRDYFAAKAMATLISSEGDAEAKEYAIAAYQVADAMIAERGRA